MYPNPTNDILNFKGISKSFTDAVVDVMGKNIINKTLQTNESLDVSTLLPGIYLIKFENYNEIFKFIKKINNLQKFLN